MSKKLDIATESGSKVALIDENLLKSKVHIIRGVKVMLDADLAEIYGYTVKAFNQQVKNNLGRFEEDFRFQLDETDLEAFSRSKILTLNYEGLHRRRKPAVTWLLQLRSNRSTYRSKHTRNCNHAFRLRDTENRNSGE